MKTVICFKQEKATLERLGYKPALIKQFHAGRPIYQVDVDFNFLPEMLRDNLFEPVFVSATRLEISELRRCGVHRLFKADGDSIALFLKPVTGELPQLLIPYTDFGNGFLRQQREDKARESKKRIEFKEMLDNIKNDRAARDECV